MERERASSVRRGPNTAHVCICVHAWLCNVYVGEHVLCLYLCVYRVLLYVRETAGLTDSPISHNTIKLYTSLIAAKSEYSALSCEG